MDAVLCHQSLYNRELHNNIPQAPPYGTLKETILCIIKKICEGNEFKGKKVCCD